MRPSVNTGWRLSRRWAAVSGVGAVTAAVLLGLTYLPAGESVPTTDALALQSAVSLAAVPSGQRDVSLPATSVTAAALVGTASTEHYATLLRTRLIGLLPGIGADGHATPEIESLLEELEHSPLTAAVRQQMLWELVLGQENPAARRLLYDMIERVGSSFIAQRIVEHFDAVLEPTERSRVLQLLARGLEVRGGSQPDPAVRYLLERNTERVAELMQRLLSTPGQQSSVLATTLNLLPDVVPAQQALQSFTDARRLGVLSSSSFFDVAVRVVFSEPEQTALHASALLQSLSRESDEVRAAVNPKLYAFIAAGSLLPAADRIAVENYLQIQEAALFAQANQLSSPEWLAVHNALLQARSKVDGTHLDLSRGTGISVVARSTLVNSAPTALGALDTPELAALLNEMRTSAPNSPGAIGTAMQDAMKLVQEELQVRSSRVTLNGRSGNR